MESITWEVGGVKIIQLIEIEGGAVIQEAIPEATRENIVKIPWLVPHFADSEGNLKALVQAFIVDTGKTRIIIDTCLGNEKKRTDVPEWGSLQTDFLERLEDCGYPRNDIDIVLCTHLHFDHVGWNTMLFDGEWVATFPKARYLFAKDEFDYWKAKPEEEIEDDRAGFSDSVLPVCNAGLADLVSVDHVVNENVRLIPTPGHTPAHVSVLIESDGKQAVVTGDVAHHPCQIEHPHWSTLADNDKEQACATRKAFFEQFADTKALVIGSHFSLPTAGYLVREGDGYSFKF